VQHLEEVFQSYPQRPLSTYCKQLDIISEFWQSEGAS
jgi:hypothetical protein